MKIQIENIKAYNADCMNIIKNTPDKYFDLAIVDPPYGININQMQYTRETKRTCIQKNGKKLYVTKKEYTKKDWDLSAPDQHYFNELKRISKEQIIFGIDYFDWSVPSEGRIKWNKGYSKKVSFKDFERAYCSIENKEIEINLLWAGFMQAKSLSEPMTQQGNKKLNQKRIHPTEKPILLYKRLLLDYASKGYRIIDTHGGSFSHAIACFDLGYDLTIIEKDKYYFDKAINRLNEHRQQHKLNFNV